MPRGFLVKRRCTTSHQMAALSDDDVITSHLLPVSSHESPDSGYCAASPPPSRYIAESTLPPTNGTPRDVTAQPPCLMTSSSVLRTAATNFYQQLMLRRHAAETILAAAAAAKTGNTSLLQTGSGSLLGTGSGSSGAGLFPVCSLPLAPYIMPVAALGNGAVALNLCSKTGHDLDAEPRTASTADDTTGQYNIHLSAVYILINCRSIRRIIRGCLCVCLSCKAF